MDDVLCLWKGTRSELSDFEVYLNNIMPSLKFTTELESNNSLNFLDVKIEKIPGRFKFDIYRKPTTCSALIPADSCHYHSQKLAAFRSMTQRIYRLGLDGEEERKEKENIKLLGRLNGYDSTVIEKVFRREEMKQHPLYTKPVMVTNPTWRKFNFHHKRVANINNFLKRSNIRCGFSTNSNILGYLKRRSTREGKLLCSGVYRIKCDDCDAFYYGETGRTVKERTKEHRNAKHTSAFGKHLLDSGHKSKDDDNIKVIHTREKGFTLTLLEAYEIWKERGNKNLLNEQVELRRQPLFKICS